MQLQNNKTVAVAHQTVPVVRQTVAVRHQTVAVSRETVAVARETVAVVRQTVAVAHQTVAVARQTVVVRDHSPRRLCAITKGMWLSAETLEQQSSNKHGNLASTIDGSPSLCMAASFTALSHTGTLCISSS